MVLLKKLIRKNILRSLCWLWILAVPTLHAQVASIRPMDAAEILQEIYKLRELKKVLYVAAHPDDENTRMIAWLANDRRWETAYVSLTRGDGGQNLIGNELGDALGIIRTQELIEARKTDGGIQYFTRARDFGFSKTPEETLQIWDEEKVLEDLTAIIRHFKPDVIITRFSPEPSKTHGHHTASAQLAIRAFHAASDPQRFPHQVANLGIWKSLAVYWNTSWFFYGSREAFEQTPKNDWIALNVGTYLPLLGKSCNEISAFSRSKHSSQGFGTEDSRGIALEYLRHLAGETLQESYFTQPVQAWNALPGGSKIDAQILKLIRSYQPEHPHQSIPALLKLRKDILAMPAFPAQKNKLMAIDRLLAAMAGLFAELRLPKAAICPGDTVLWELEVTQRAGNPWVFQSLHAPDWHIDTLLTQNLMIEKPTLVRAISMAPNDPLRSHPFWLTESPKPGMFENHPNIPAWWPENPPTVAAHIRFQIMDQTIDYQVKGYYKYTDRVKGAVYENVFIQPSVMVEVSPPLLFFTNNQSQKCKITWWSPFPEPEEGHIGRSGDWNVQIFSGTGQESRGMHYSETWLEIKPPIEWGTTDISLFLDSEGNIPARQRILIQYPHIEQQAYWKPASLRLVKMDLKVPPHKKIGYIMGSGDEIPLNLSKVGIQIELISPDELSDVFLQEFDAVVIGIRALNVHTSLAQQMPLLFDFVREGGNLIVQYQTSGDLKTPQIAPKSLQLSRDRITDEQARLKWLQPGHPVFNQPNILRNDDFDGWIQERGLYFAGKRDPSFISLLSGHDPQESDSDGILLVLPYGKGNYVYTGLSLFRQIPHGNPGAFRLLTNLIFLPTSDASISNP